jgi:arabinose-5-phosphate isomerase
MSSLERAREVIQIEIEALLALERQLDDRFDQAVQLLVQCLTQGGKIVIVGIGKSGLIGRKIAATLTSTGSPAVMLDSIDALHGDLGLVGNHDVILALSYSGESDELLHLLPSLKQFAVRIIALTGSQNSTLAQHSDLVLNVQVPKEACPFNLAPTASTTATLVLGDALAMAVLSARGFKVEDFARRHPSGAIGRSLLLKVRDIMRKADRNAVADEQSTVREAILIMTRAKSGSVAVVNAEQQLIGVFTDGDLRRQMAVDPTLLDRCLTEVMTRDPVVVSDQSLAVEALHVFKQRNIDDLIVVDTDGKPVGMVDIQDLPKLKLM